MKYRPHMHKQPVQGDACRDQPFGSALCAGPRELEKHTRNNTQLDAKEACHYVRRPAYRVPVQVSIVQCDSALLDAMLVDADGCAYAGRMHVSLVIDALSDLVLGVRLA